MPQGVYKGNMFLTTIARDGTKGPSGYNVSGAEGDGETQTITCPCTKSTVYVGHVTCAD